MIAIRYVASSVGSKLGAISYVSAQVPWDGVWRLSRRTAKMRTWRLIRYLYDRYYGYDVFISYSRRHSTNYAVSLLRQLQALGLTCFLDQRDIYAGAPLDSLILAALERSSAVVPVITRGTEASAYVPVEIAHALKLERWLAQTRRGKPCQSPAVAGTTRCRMHGGAAGSGAPKGKRNGKYRHGGFPTEAIDERMRLASLIRDSRDLLSRLR
jgi:hypothetical protein